MKIRDTFTSSLPTGLPNTMLAYKTFRAQNWI